MPKGLLQLASFQIDIGAGKPKVSSLDITGRDAIFVDRMVAFLTVEPASNGSMPTMDQIATVERCLRLRLSLDRNDSKVLTIGTQAVKTFQQLNTSPIQVPPFELRGSEQPTVKVEYPVNLEQNAVFTAFGAVKLEIVFYGQGLN